MGMEAWVQVKFFDEYNNQIRTVTLDCYKCRAECREITIPSDAKSVIVCFTTSNEGCENCTDE